ncbi:Glu/Leu/Phe/Val dehydrogenase family protein [Solirubrobacter soli]|uniref:Glu/Leu/Phe/Val dehydrogenase family protein n=1 Tax=Solirubrobacter soli TaxID=363832 RepID=UPI00055E3AA0|nr:Glu/Leu/Phe/Val dehydrogenase family protein [Solirubrobacter soli]
MSAFEHLLTGWDGQQVAVRYDADFATWMFIGVHSTFEGRSGGGTRMAVYDAPEDGLADALKLSAAMTRKMAVCNVSMGGGKAVLAVPELPVGEARVELLHRYGDFIGSLNGLYATAPDVNTSERDMDTIGERTEHVFCRSVANGGSGSTAPATAVGVFHGIRASVGHALGTDLTGVKVLVQGFGAVGSLLAQQLKAAGADVLVSDIDPTRVDGFAAVDPQDVIGTECDVYAPCAMGGTITATTVEALRCRVVAGAANNQLADPSLADRLHERGILYAPDYVINSGGVLHGTGLELLGWDHAQLDEALRGLGDTLLELYAGSDRSPVHAAEALVARRRGLGR